jgi:heptosyltransferase-2
MDVDPPPLESRLKNSRVSMKEFDYLIRIPNHLGDCIMAQPPVQALAGMIGDTAIGLILPQWAESIYNDIGNTELIPIPRFYLHGWKGIKYQTELLKKFRAETGILLTPSFSSALVFFLADIKKRWGFAGQGRGFLLEPAVKPFNNMTLHRSDQYRALMETALNWRLNTLGPDIRPGRKATEEALQLLLEKGLSPQDRYMVIAPQAVAESRRWGSKNYAALAEKIVSESGYKIVLIGSAAESAAGAAVAGDNKGIINLCGRTDIEAAAAILSRAGFFVGNDSGPAHLASAVDIPLVVLSGADNPAETSPLSDKKTVIIRDNLDCISCVKNKCPLHGDSYMRCMNDISVDEVFEAARSHLNF